MRSGPSIARLNTRERVLLQHPKRGLSPHRIPWKSILNEQASYGYAIIKRVKELSQNELQWTEGMLYPVLHRLEEQNFIESYWSASETGRQRKYYRILEKGVLELEKLRRQWEIVHNVLEKSWGK